MMETRTFVQEINQRLHKTSFFMLLRRIEALYAHCERLGKARRLIDDPVRLGQQPTLGFAPSTLARIDYRETPDTIEILQYFFGVFGPNGPLPLHLTEYVHERLHQHKDAALARFADIFHHRLLALFYRIWANAQPVVHADRPESDRFAFYLNAFSGIAEKTRNSAMETHRRLYCHWTGLLNLPSRHPQGLAALIRNAFSVPVDIQEWIGTWLKLEQEDLCVLGKSRKASHQLGVGSLLGRRVFQRQTKFRIVLGPLTQVQYQHFLPKGKNIPALQSIVRFYVGGHFEWDVALVLKKEEVPVLRLERNKKYSGRLGCDAWVIGREFYKSNEKVKVVFSVSD